MLGLGGSTAYNTYIYPITHNEGVWVASHPIPRNHVITPGDLQYASIDRKVVEPNAVLNNGAIVGQMASEDIDQGQQITPTDLESDPLALTPGTYDYPVPAAWVYAIEDTLRQGDRVDVYEYPRNASAPVMAIADKPLLSNIVVEHVRNASNQEVTNQSPDPGPTTTDNRDNGTSTPAKLELKLTQAEITKLTRESLQNQFIFYYTTSQQATKH